MYVLKFFSVTLQLLELFLLTERVESYPAISEQFEIQFESETKHKGEKLGILF